MQYQASGEAHVYWGSGRRIASRDNVFLEITDRSRWYRGPRPTILEHTKMIHEAGDQHCTQLAACNDDQGHFLRAANQESTANVATAHAQSKNAGQVCKKRYTALQHAFTAWLLLCHAFLSNAGQEVREELRHWQHRVTHGTSLQQVLRLVLNFTIAGQKFERCCNMGNTGAIVASSYCAKDIRTVQNFLCKQYTQQNKLASLLCTAILGFSGNLG